jgi:transposase-like protein
MPVREDQPNRYVEPRRFASAAPAHARLPSAQEKPADILADRKNIVALCARGMATHEIAEVLRSRAGRPISARAVAAVRDEQIEHAQMWRERPLDAVYVMVSFLTFPVSIRSVGVRRIAVMLVAVGVRRDGRKEIIGVWPRAETQEAAALFALKRRGVQNILFCVMNHPPRLGATAMSAFPATIVLPDLHTLAESIPQNTLASIKQALSSAPNERALNDAIGPFAAASALAGLSKAIRRVIYINSGSGTLKSKLQRRAITLRRQFSSEHAAYTAFTLMLHSARSGWRVAPAAWRDAAPGFAAMLSTRVCAGR